MNDTQSESKSLTDTTLVGFTSVDQALLKLKDGDVRYLKVPGGLQLAFEIFQAALAPDGNSGAALVQASLGELDSHVQADFAFENKLLRSLPKSRLIVKRGGKGRPESSPNFLPQVGQIVAILRRHEAVAEFSKQATPSLPKPSDKDVELGLDVFVRNIHELVNLHKQRCGLPLVVVLGVLPNPSVVRAGNDKLVQLFKRTVDSKPVGETKLGRRVLVTSARAFREAGHRIREDGSTSAAVEDIYGLVCGDPKMKAHNVSEETRKMLQVFFSSFDEIVVRIRADSLLHFTRPADSFKADLHYIVAGNRQNWIRYRDGNIGFDFILAAVIAQAGAEQPLSKEVLNCGLQRVWLMLEHGFAGEDDAKHTKDPAGLLSVKVLFKRCDPSASEDNKKEAEVSVLEDLIDGRLRHRNRWTLFREVCEKDATWRRWRDEYKSLHSSKLDKDELENAAIAFAWDQIALRFAREGPEKARSSNVGDSLGKYRVFSLGDVRSVDRDEIDGLISLQQLFFTFLGQERRRHPLCVGVFGAPGSGKSFGVKEIAKSLHEWKQPVAATPLEFNVAQFTSLNDLCVALHRVRDLHLETGQTPVAIFDEFDAEFQSRPFGWLQYFLMPMQDGKFMEGSVVHHTGPAIFIFAGGVNHSFGEFASRQRDRGFCAAKGPDFISRLRGIHNVPPINRPDNFENFEYPAWKIRRAILLNSYFKRHDVRIDDNGLLGTLLNVPRFHHGARSLEALIEMSARVSGKNISRSSLPRRDQLELHLDAVNFWDELRER